MKHILAPLLWLFATSLMAQTVTQTLALDCRIQYKKDGELSHRATWLQYEKGKLTLVKIDDQPVHRFSVNGTTIATSMDSERIQIEFLPTKIVWRSNLRDIEFGNGLCVKLKQ